MIYGVPEGEVRAGHRHKRIIQACICLNGSCRIDVELYGKRTTYRLERPNQLLILDPQDWHTLSEFSKNAYVVVMSSDFYDKDDYVSTPL